MQGVFRYREIAPIPGFLSIRPQPGKVGVCRWRSDSVNCSHPQWQKTIGRVVFLNCDPIFDGLDNDWTILPAPPAWLTGHLLRRDCLVASIPLADYAKHFEDLVLLPEIGISSHGSVGSVLLFGARPVEEMRDIALPTDSATSNRLLQYLLEKRGLSPRAIEMGPDLPQMLKRCDGALLIGDRALWEAEKNPQLVRMDLGQAWYDETGLPMVFGVFAARKDSPEQCLADAHNDLVKSLERFSDEGCREIVIANSSIRTGFSVARVKRYFTEVSNKMEKMEVEGLNKFLAEVCGVDEVANFVAF